MIQNQTHILILVKKLDIDDKLKSVPNNLSDLKSTVDKLDVDTLVW